MNMQPETARPHFLRRASLKTSAFLKALRTKVIEYFGPSETTLAGITVGLFAGFAVIIILSGVIFLPALGWIAFLVVTLSIMLISFLGAFLTVSLMRLLNKIPFWLTTALLAGIPVIMMFFHMTSQGTLLVYFLLALCFALTGGALWRFRRRWPGLRKLQRVLLLLYLAVGLAGLAGGVYWLLHPGQPVEMPPNAAMSAEHLPDLLELENPGVPGPYAVETLSYGSGNDQRRAIFGEKATLITETVDASDLLGSWSGFSGNMRTRYFGFGPSELPLNAMVWYPEGEGPFPLVLIVHGNHLAQNASDPGYAYLGELLASRGYIMASVDQNFLNGSYFNIPSGLRGENNVRGWLLLKHLEVWQQWQEDPGHLFYGKVDMENIALVGHSRGGEAVAHAALFNRLPHNPDDGGKRFGFHFSIRSVIAIAPSDGQYQPARTRTPLTDVNYLVLQGSHDADVSSYQGMRQYNRVSFSEDFDGFKAGVYIWNANHGQFNSVWGRTDFAPPRINFFNLAQLIPEEEQQIISKIYIGAFLDATLKGERGYRSLFMDHRHGRHWLPETIYITQYEQPGTQYFATFMEDLDLTTATLPGSTIHATDMTIWREQTLYLNWGDYETRAVMLGWNTTEDDELRPSYHVQWPAGAIETGTTSTLVFSLADTGETANPPEKPDGDDGDNGDLPGNGDEEVAKALDQTGADDGGGEENHEDPEDAFIDFTIRLGDAHGGVLEFPLSSCMPLQPILYRELTKLPFMQRAGRSEVVLQHFYFPMAALADLYPDFDFDNIRCMDLIFDKTPQGVVVLNDLGFVR